MKKFVNFFSISLIALVSLFTTSCGGSSGLITMGATGNPYEMLVVAPKDVWKGDVGDSIRMVFADEVLWLNQPEPLFDLVNVTPKTLNDIMRRHRNIFIVKSNSAADTVAFSVRQNVWVNGQIVIDLTAPSVAEAAEYIGENGKTILDYLSLVERQRMAVRIKKYNDKKLDELIANKFDFRMYIPQGYRIANDKLPDFLWLTYEMPLSSQGVVIYTFPRPADTLKLNIVEERNKAVMQIPGPVDGSYMTTDMVLYPDSKPVEINGQAWIETRGFWRVEGDFMGGAFINYATYDVKLGKYIAIDLYVYSPSPRYEKRNYLRQLEALMEGVKL